MTAPGGGRPKLILEIENGGEEGGRETGGEGRGGRLIDVAGERLGKRVGKELEREGGRY